VNAPTTASLEPADWLLLGQSNGWTASDLLKLADVRLTIPMQPDRLRSAEGSHLNLSVAGAVALFEALRSWRQSVRCGACVKSLTKLSLANPKSPNKPGKRKAQRFESPPPPPARDLGPAIGPAQF